jgi:presenilin-like A22 family membrane protease
MGLSLIIESMIGFTAAVSLALVAALQVRGIVTPSTGGTTPGLTELIIALAVGTVFMLVALRFKRGKRLFTTLFAISMFVGIGTLVGVFAPAPVAVTAAVCAIALRYLVPRIITHDLVLVIGVAGAAMGIGLTTNWRTVLIFAAALSVYDLVAVYKTKHMITLMKEVASRGALFALVFTGRPRDLVANVRDITPKAGFYFLGSGDVVVPAMIAVSALQISEAAALGAALGSFVGFAFTQVIFFSQSVRRPMPALPPIATGAILGMLLVYFLKI